MKRTIIACHARPSGPTWLYYSDGSTECFDARGWRVKKPGPAPQLV